MTKTKKWYARSVYFLVAAALVAGLMLVPAVPAAADGPVALSGYEIVTSPEMSFGDGGWGGWSVPNGKVVLGGGFHATAPVSASAPGTPNSVWPHYTYGLDEYGWVVRDAIDGVSNTITIYAICADKPAGYEVVTSAALNYSDGGWAGWSVPNGKVVLGGGFVLSDPSSTSAGAAAVSVPGTPGTSWPHGYTYGPDEYGWVVRAAEDGVSDPNSKIYVIYADEPAGYQVITSNILNYSDGGWGGWSVPNGKVVLGGGFNLTGGPAAVSVPGTPNSSWPHYTYGPHEYGWVVQDAPDENTSWGSTLYAIYADLSEVWVDDNWALELGDPADGHTFGYDAFAIIQDGIDAVAEAGTVNVAAGTYTPTSTITINKDNLNLVGPQADVDPRPSYDSTRTAGSAQEAVIDGGLNNLGMIIAIDADNIVINGLEVKSGTGDMIRQSDAHSATIVRYCIIHDGRGDEGVQLKKCTNGVLEYNYVYDIAHPGDALNISDASSNGSIRYNEVCDIGSENAAIYVYGSTDMEIVGNLVYNVPNNDGIKLGGKKGSDAGTDSNSVIAQNIVHDTAQDGISVYTSGVTVEGNEVYNSSSENGAIYLAFAIRDIAIQNNSVYDNVLHPSVKTHVGGIGIESPVDAASVHINNNNIYNNTPYGVNNDASAVVDATNNWWGNASGPGQDGANDVSDNVAYSPWLGQSKDAAHPWIFCVDDVGPEPAAGYIQTAIDAASEGDTINVAAGTYEEEITIDEDLTLLGAQADVPIVEGERAGDESIIRGKGTGSYGYSWCVVRIKHSDVVINGFTIENGQRDIAIQGGLSGHEGISNILISYNYIENTGTKGSNSGIFRDNAVADVTITHNYIASNPNGIKTNGGATTITNNTFYGNGTGIDFQEGDPYDKYFPDYAEPDYPTIISGNTFENDSTSINLRLDKCHQSITITGNDITEARSVAIKTWKVYDESLVNPAIHYNNIWNNEFGINNQVSGVNLNATNNWWDDVSGPAHASNPSGTGDPVSDDVAYSPWLGDPIGTEPMTFVELVTSTDPDPVTLLDEDDNPIATVDISGGDASSGTIAAYSEPEDPKSGEESLAVGTGKNGVVFVDVQVTGYTSGIAHITVPYPDTDNDGIVDDTDPPIDENTLGLYYWDEAASMWRIAANNLVLPDANTVSGDIPVSALGGTPIGAGGYPADEATVEIGDISVGYSGNDIVALTITTKTAQLGAATIDLSFDNTVVEVLGGENSEFDSLTVNPVFDTGKARFVANQLGASGVDAIGGAVLAQVRLKAVGTTGSSSPLTLSVITLKDNDGISIPLASVINGTATIGGLGDANSDGAVDVYDCVYIARAIAGIPGYIENSSTMDVDGKDGVDVFDCTYLARHIAGIVGYEGLGG